ncbi:MAG: aspartate kinase [Eubacteriales bacterium]|jgi:aspartate kinase|nr:aspartate kinase [Eubacteriales bacterium]MDO5585892.1 aspartate kinase [Clostridia bacterium]MDY4213665.1 aspartate kinase [Eubacteriales bacterium]MDY5231238.1 aspartate kinase [Eubacteriales bacterium]
MALIVQKFGGSSVADANRVRNVANRVVETANAGNKVVVVVSAQGDTTDDLIEKAMEINPNASKREMDMLLSSGEQISIALLAMAIQKIGHPVVSLTGWQAGFRSNAAHSNARISRIDTERIETELDRGNIAVVAGFQGINKYDDITTLGRGGSDTSAVAIAAALHADKCEIYTDVDGVYTADPRIVKDAKKLSEITYDEMLELASLGANVLHNRSVEMAKKYNVPLEVKSSFEKVDGTVVKEVTSMEKMLIRGVTRDNDVARIAVIGVENTPGIAFRIFSALAKENINVDMILQSVGRNGKKDIAFTVTKAHKDETLKVIDGLKDILNYEEVNCRDDLSKVSIVGAGMVTNPGVAAKMFEALFAADINIHMIATSEIKVSVLIKVNNAERAVKVIHDKFNV